LAVEACAAAWSPVEGDEIAFLEAFGSLSDGFDEAGSFVARDEGEGMFGVAGDEVPVAVADADGSDLDQDLPFLGRLEIEGLDLEGFSDGVEDGGAGLHWFDCDEGMGDFVDCALLSNLYPRPFLLISSGERGVL